MENGEHVEKREKRVAIRRWGDKCFHLVDEVVEEGYILDGHLIRHEDVVDVIDRKEERSAGEQGGKESDEHFTAE